MWWVTQHGFYNIIQYPEDKEADLLTVKARRREDLEEFEFANFLDIEESTAADYRFRVKVRRHLVSLALTRMVAKIDYHKTKDRLKETHPERSRIYLEVWGILSDLQDP